jgi:hypothetical protein
LPVIALRLQQFLAAFQLDRLHVLLGWFPRIEEGLSQRNPPHPIPSLEYPSDHLPISAMFQFRSLQQHINCVRALQGEPSFRRQSAFNTNFEEEQAVTSPGSVE